MELSVTAIRIDGETVSLKCEDVESVRTFKILLDDYLAQPLSQGQLLDDRQVIRLDRQHLYCYAYRRCLRFLAGADHTEKEVRNKLARIEGLAEEDGEKIVSQLLQLGYLNDDNAAAAQLYSDQNKLLGRRKTLYNLTGRGIEKNKAQQLLSEVSDSQETERGKLRAMKIWQRDRSRPYRQRLAHLRRQLIIDGYEDVDAILQNLDLPSDSAAEEALLQKDLEKAVRKYERKAQGQKLRSQVIQYLLARGHEYEMIQKYYRQEGEEYEDQ